MLFSLAQTCDIDMGLNDTEHKNKSSQLRAIEALGGEESYRTMD